jgi:hypothetical protein
MVMKVAKYEDQSAKKEKALEPLIVELQVTTVLHEQQ